MDIVIMVLLLLFLLYIFPYFYTVIAIQLWWIIVSYYKSWKLLKKSLA